jgi:hypothetical protein
MAHVRRRAKHLLRAQRIEPSRCLPWPSAPMKNCNVGHPRNRREAATEPSRYHPARTAIAASRLPAHRSAPASRPLVEEPQLLLYAAPHQAARVRRPVRVSISVPGCVVSIIPHKPARFGWRTAPAGCTSSSLLRVAQSEVASLHWQGPVTCAARPRACTSSTAASGVTAARPACTPARDVQVAAVRPAHEAARAPRAGVAA